LLVGGKPIRSHTVIWTAGVTNHPFFAENKFLMAQNGKVQVDKYLRAWPNIYVIGDNASTPYSGMAQTALHDAHYVSRSLIAKSRGKKPKPYAPKKPIYVTPAGPKWAAVVWGPLHLYGRLGWWFRRAADWIGYRDVEPWWKASARFMAENIKED
jgi:NADH dehydrogenase